MKDMDLAIKDSGPVLSDLLKTIEGLAGSPYVYLNRLNDQEFVYSGGADFRENAFGIMEAKLPESLKVLGIRGMSLDSLSDKAAFLKFGAIAPELYLQKGFFKTHAVLEDLKLLFQHCRTIAFDDWANIANASDLWVCLLTDVIRPLQKKDLDFIFYLGDPSEMLSFEVDEILDIISDFSSNGRVTFVMDEHEAMKLWRVLNGIDAGAVLATPSAEDLVKRYRSIYATMSISRLFLYSVERALIISKEESFILERKRVFEEAEVSKEARDRFIAGFCMGLLLQIPITHCVGLGLLVFEAHAGNDPIGERKELLTYLRNYQ